MNDIIYRSSAITLPVMPKEYRKYQTQNIDDAYDQGWYDLQKCIEQLPSAKPEIIYCKDCKHWQSEEYIGNNNVHTLNLASLPCKNWSTAGDWHCGSGERREK